MNKRELKEKAQELLYDSLNTAFYAVWDDRFGQYAEDPETREALIAELHKQANRVAKTLGFQEFITG